MGFKCLPTTMVSTGSSALCRPRRRSSAVLLLPYVLLLISTSLHPLWVGAHKTPHPRVSRPQHGVAQRASPDEDGELEEARLAAEAAKLRLEAEKLRSEAELWRSSVDDSSERAVSVDSSVESAAAPAPAVAPQGGAATSIAQASQAAPDEAVTAEAAALVASPVIRQAVSKLLRFQEANGSPALQDLLLRACTELEEEGGGSVDKVCGDGSLWQAAGIDPAEARESLAAVVELLTPRGSPVGELKGAQGDRAAVLKILLFDQLPETSRAFAKVVGLEGGSTDANIQDMTVGAELQISEEERKAVRFLGRLELIPEAERTPERLRRLRELPLVQQATELASSEEELVKLGSALAPLEARLYEATRTAQLRQRPPEETNEDRVQVISLEFGIFQVLGVLVVIAALAYTAAQGVKGAMRPNPEQVPMYSLQTTKSGYYPSSSS